MWKAVEFSEKIRDVSPERSSEFVMNVRAFSDQLAAGRRKHSKAGLKRDRTDFVKGLQRIHKSLKTLSRSAKHFNLEHRFVDLINTFELISKDIYFRFDDNTDRSPAQFLVRELMDRTYPKVRHKDLVEHVLAEFIICNGLAVFRCEVDEIKIRTAVMNAYNQTKRLKKL